MPPDYSADNQRALNLGPKRAETLLYKITFFYILSIISYYSLTQSQVLTANREVSHDGAWVILKWPTPLCQSISRSREEPRAWSSRPKTPDDTKILNLPPDLLKFPDKLTKILPGFFVTLKAARNDKDDNDSIIDFIPHSHLSASVPKREWESTLARRQVKGWCLSAYFKDKPPLSTSSFQPGHQP